MGRVDNIHQAVILQRRAWEQALQSVAYAEDISDFKFI